MSLRRPPLRNPGTLVLLPALALALAACNSLTGADDLLLYGAANEGGSGGESDDGSGPATTGQAPSTGVGGGGGSSGEGAGHPGQGGSTSSSTSSATSSSSSTSTSSSSSGGGGGVGCDYPVGGAGVQIGNHVQGNLAWQGFPDGASESAAIAIQDYFDCDGSKGIHALLIINSATWCGACQEEAADLPSHAATFAAKGIRVLTLMVQNASGAPASLATATSWRNNFGLDAYATAADPNFTFAGNGDVGLPLQLIVDPRTMEIVDRIEGYGDYTSLTQLASQNAN